MVIRRRDQERSVNFDHLISLALASQSVTPFSREVIATCAELNIPVVAYSPLGRGFLTGSLGKLSGEQPTLSGHLGCGN